MTKKLLLVNDSAAIREVVELTFENSEINIQFASSLQEAMETIRRESPEIIVADADKVELGAWDLCNEIKGNPALSSIPIILLTGDEDEPSPSLGTMPEFFLQKPFASNELQHTVTSLLGTQQKKEQRLDKDDDGIYHFPDGDTKEIHSQGLLKSDIPSESFDGGKADVSPGENDLDLASIEVSTSATTEGTNPEEHIKASKDPEPTSPTINISREKIQIAIESTITQIVSDSLKDMNPKALENLIASSIREAIQEITPNLIGLVERVAREIIPELAEIWIQQEIQRLKGGE